MQEQHISLIRGTRQPSNVRCVAANCGNFYRDGVSMHAFPKDPSLRRAWINFVKSKRVWNGPTEFSKLCSEHFTADCFPFRYLFELEHMGITSRNATLNHGAIPTVHSTSAQCHRSTSGSKSESSSTSSRMDFPSSSPPNKIRRAYCKRETARIISSYEEENQLDCINDTVAVESEVETSLEAFTALSAISIGCQVNIRQKQVSKYCQTRARKGAENNQKSKLVNKGTQTDEVGPQLKDASMLVRPEYLEPTSTPKEQTSFTETSDEVDDRIFSSPMKDDPMDHDYEPPSSPTFDDHVSGPQSRNLPPEQCSKYIVFERNLLDLFNVCQKCCSATSGKVVYVNGSLVQIMQECQTCAFSRTWTSQPLIANKPAGNVLVSAAILYSGSVPSKALRMLKFMKIATISMSTYLNHQRFFLYPAIAHVWHNFQEGFINKVTQNNRSLVVGGDGRADTPGHCAKFGSYTMLDLEEGVVLDVQLVQSNEVKNSTHMEKEGLARSIKFLHENGINIQCIVTDRHVQIIKWIRENLIGTIHYFDVWHVAKGLKKKLHALAKEKDCSDLFPWIKSLVNHLYWTAATGSGDEDGCLKTAKWLSVLNHIINIHEGHGGLFPSCKHGELEGRERKKKWLKPGTKVYEKLDDLLSSRQMKRDVPMLSPQHQTSALEGYHSVINHFAPKMTGFSFHGMLCRLWLAALHFNENVNRKQAFTQDGKPRYSIVYPKYKKGEYTLRKIAVECTHDYVDTLISTTFRLAETSFMNEDRAHLLIEVPPPLCSNYHRPELHTAIKSLLSRFNSPDD